MRDESRRREDIGATLHKTMPSTHEPNMNITVTRPDDTNELSKQKGLSSHLGAEHEHHRDTAG